MIAKVIHVNINRIKELYWNVEKNVKRGQYIKNEVFPLLQKYGFSTFFYDAIMIPDFVYNRRGDELYVKNYDKYINYNNEIIPVGLNNNDPPRNYEIALFLGHYNLWKECVEKNTPMLIMEDDVMFTEDTVFYISKKIKKFVDNEQLLYLQAVCPSSPTTYKTYKPDNLKDIGDYYLVSKNHTDFSGTCCYYITPSSAKILIKFVSIFGVICIDGFIHNCHKKTNLNICIPKEYTNTAKLHPEYC